MATNPHWCVAILLFPELSYSVPPYAPPTAVVFQGRRSRQNVRVALSLHPESPGVVGETAAGDGSPQDRKSTRLNSSHQIISYAVFCLKKKKKHQNITNEECQHS